MALFAACRMKTFARLISDELGVRVHFHGKQILARAGRPPVIVLPAIEYASEEVMKSVRGFALHEAGHVRWSDFSVVRGIRSYIEKELHNAIEDEWMEARLERVFPGAREMLVAAHREGLEIVHGRPEALRETSWLAPESKGDVLDALMATIKTTHMQAGMPEADAKKAAEEAMTLVPEEKVTAFATRLELRRAALCWLYRKRGYDRWVNLHDWDVHPWKPIFDEETSNRAKSTKDALDQARRILERLGIQHQTEDERPADRLRELAEQAKATREAARAARRTMRKAKKEAEAEIRSKVEGSPEESGLKSAQRERRRADKKAERLKNRADTADQRAKDARSRLDRAQSKAAGLRKKLASCTDAGQRAIIQEELNQAEGRATRAQERLQACQRREEAARHAYEQARREANAADGKVCDAQAGLDALEARVRSEVMAERGADIERLTQEFEAAKKMAQEAKEAFERLAKEVRLRDRAIEAPIQPGVREEAVRRAWERHRERDVREDMESMSPEDSKEGVPEAALPDFSGETKTYTVHDRSQDVVERVQPTPQAHATHAAALLEQAPLVRRLVESLRRLQSPVQSRVKLNLERGKLDARRLYRVGMAQRGAPVDARRVWKATVRKMEPKVAVSLLLDCSGSMTQRAAGKPSHMQVALKSAAALSAALGELGIPHEVLGHTTGNLRGKNHGELDLASFSRFTPFRGYVFKSFEGSESAALFSPMELRENLDGEAVLWAASRLESRGERTRVLLVISDGLPAACEANVPELERHLLAVCRTLEAREPEGFFLGGIGIGADRVKGFYRNCSVIQDVSELPDALLAMVGRVVEAASVPA